ncbi:rhodanese-like domain-containing protein [Agromyces sp. NPDC049794]|uniref:rhodanese-like domain-containing protein n=1 Tax=unclassified Agromyces TaxID=2639701 RepID=UPI0033CEB14D
MQSISPTEAHAIGDAYIIDVREPEELAQASVPGAHHIPLAALPARVGDVPRDRTVYVMCHAGGRSARATQFLEAEGFDAVNIDGGITRWHGDGLPITLGSAA